jgi:hypothetical protein
MLSVLKYSKCDACIHVMEIMVQLVSLFVQIVFHMIHVSEERKCHEVIRRLVSTFES